VVNAPLPLTAAAVSLLLIHAVRALGGEALQLMTLKQLALAAKPFFATFSTETSEGQVAYAHPLAALWHLFSVSLIHADWVHVLMNAGLLLGAGKPVFEGFQRLFPNGRGSATIAFFVLYLLSVAGGSLAWLAITGPADAITFGASGGASGLLGTVLLIFQSDGGRILSPKFLRVSAAFCAINLVLALVGPALLGARIGWQAHIGGYVAGVLLFKLIAYWRVR
jgi:membrane associated rhomboid family serine protease